MVKQPGFYPKVLALVLPFDWFTWIGVILSLLVVIAFYVIYASIGLDKYKHNTKYLETCLTHFSYSDVSPVIFGTYVLTTILMQSNKLTFKIKGTGIRVMTCILLMTMFVLDSGYSSSLVSVLTGKLADF